MPVFFTFLNTRIWWGECNQAVAPGITRLSATPGCYDNRSGVKQNLWAFMVWQTSCWNGFGEVLKEIMMIFVCGVFK